MIEKYEEITIKAIPCEKYCPVTAYCTSKGMVNGIFGYRLIHHYYVTDETAVVFYMYEHTGAMSYNNFKHLLCELPVGALLYKGRDRYLNGVLLSEDEATLILEAMAAQKYVHGKYKRRMR